MPGILLGPLQWFLILATCLQVGSLIPTLCRSSQETVTIRGKAARISQPRRNESSLSRWEQGDFFLMKLISGCVPSRITMLHNFRRCHLHGTQCWQNCLCLCVCTNVFTHIHGHTQLSTVYTHAKYIVICIIYAGRYMIVNRMCNLSCTFCA